MTLPAAPNAITLNDVNIELGRASAAVIQMNDGAVRYLAGQLSGSIDMGSLRGKTNRSIVTIDITGNIQVIPYLNIFNYVSVYYIPGKTDVTINISPTGRVQGTSMGAPTIDTGNGWSTGDTITINNQGKIFGRGGDGGRGGMFNQTTQYLLQASGAPGFAGSDALNIQYPTTINNTGIIGGGGGGGGGTDFHWLAAWASGGNYSWNLTTGAGGGGGCGYSEGLYGLPYYPNTEAVGGANGTNTGAGGAGQNVDVASARGTPQFPISYGGAGGSGIGVVGSNGFSNYMEGGSYTNFGSPPGGYYKAATPGGGGGLAAAGGTSGISADMTPFIDWLSGASGGTVNLLKVVYRNQNAGGAAGRCITGNQYVTWTNVGSRYGAIY